jgi:diaminopropionate ammonia-lyase
MKQTGGENMNKPIQWIPNRMPKSDDKNLSIMSLENVQKAMNFHKSIPQYRRTPLAKLDRMAEYLGIGELYIKDESYRFGLKAFKVLGGSYAIARYLAQKFNTDIASLPFPKLTSDEWKQKFGEVTFYTATDGNHGRGVAWTANQLHQKTVVFMPKGSSSTRLQNILNENAAAAITDINYDDCVRLAAASARESPNGVLIQDTAWVGYEEIPTWIMQGYGTMVLEADEQVKECGSTCPTHVFVQAGVGSLAGAVQGYFANRYLKNPPTVIVIESEAAACHYKSALAGDGQIQSVSGNLETIMVGLACGEPNPVSWDIIRNHVRVFVSCPDCVAAKGMRMSAAPLTGDPQIISGESGAVSLGLLASVMLLDEYADLRTAIGLQPDSRVLLFSTEGDTDPHRFKSIVWDGNNS